MMNLLKPSLMLLASGLLLGQAGAAVLVSDDFSTAPANPNTLGWYYSAPAPTTFSAETGALQFAASSATNNVSVFRQFSETSLGVGEAITVKMTVTTMSAVGNESGLWRVGLFDTANAFTANQGAAPWATGNEGYQMALSTVPNGTGSRLHYRQGNAGIVSTSGSETLTTADVAGNLSSTPTPLNITLAVTRISGTQVVLSGSYVSNGVLTTFSDVTLNSANANYIDKFDTIYFGNGFGAEGRGFTLDNVSVEVAAVPEPRVALLLGAGLLALGLRRRRGAA